MRQLEVTALGDREVVMRRIFDAPPHLVFDAWTKPELLQQWLGVWGKWTMPICEVDLRVGGAYRFGWRSSEGVEMGVRGVYREVVRPERIVHTEVFDEAWYPGQCLVTHVLDEKDGKAATLSTLTLLYDSTEARDAVLASPMESGIVKGYPVLDGILQTMKLSKTT